MQPNAAVRYQTQHIMTASPAALVSMLYERAIRALNDTVRAIEAGDVEARWKHNDKATEIISHFWSTLDMKRGGEIAENLSNLYRFMLKRLDRVNMHNDAEAAREVIGLLTPIAASWRELAAGGGQPMSQAPVQRQPGPIAVSA